MNVLITGTASGIGRQTALLFLERGHNVFGLDKKESSILESDFLQNKNCGIYKHFVCDISQKESDRKSVV